MFVLTCYPKNVKPDLTNADKKELRRLVPALKLAYEKGLAARKGEQVAREVDAMSTGKAPKGGRKHSEVGTSIIRGLKEAIAYASGENVEVKGHTIHVPVIDPKEVRNSMGLSQANFALKYGFSLATVRNWEQGRRAPELPAKILLAVIAKHPEVVEEVLAG